MLPEDEVTPLPIAPRGPRGSSAASAPRGARRRSRGPAVPLRRTAYPATGFWDVWLAKSAPMWVRQTVAWVEQQPLVQRYVPASQRLGMSMRA